MAVEGVAKRFCWAGLLAPLAVAILGCATASQRTEAIATASAASPASPAAVAQGTSAAKESVGWDKRSAGPPSTGYSAGAHGGPALRLSRPTRSTADIARVAYDEPQQAPLPKPVAFAADPANAAQGDGVLELESLIQEVQSVNPSLEAAIEAWHAAAYRYPQMIALEDPMFGFLKGTDMGWMVEASQKIPWPGKRLLRGNVAAAEADAMQWEVEDRRLMLAEAAAMAFYDYYQADRQQGVNTANARLVAEFRDIAKAKYETGQVSQQDVLQADVELADLEARQAELQRERKIAAARINTLLHREADHPLPPPPAKAEVPDTLPARESIVELALEARPDLASQMARIRQEEYALGLAYKDYYPDLELVVKHDHFMPPEMQNQVGMNFNVPIYRQKRHAAVCEASARLRQRRAELESRMDQVRFEVQSAWERTTERRSVVRLYENKILPASDANVQSARINYTAGKVDFLRLVEAERQFRQQQDKYHETVAEYHRRLAQLQRAVGGPLSQ